jgi:isopenicillin-N N-acyltransferase-like protein
VHLLSRRVLDEARSLEDGVVIVTDPASATRSSTSLTVLDRSGAAAILELVPGGPARLDLADEGVLLRTNSFRTPQGRDGCLAAGISDSSRVRLETLEAAFADGPPATPADVLAAMTDHVAGEGSICAHPDPATDPVLWHRTLATVTIDVAGSRLDVRSDGPCGERYREPALNG